MVGRSSSTGFKYLDAYTDRHGRPRVYFKRGKYRVTLPVKIGGPAFLKAYEAALTASALPERSRQRAERQQVASSTNPHEPRIGVYLLLLRGEVVYVGSSLGMQTRIADHRRNGRPFDQVFYVGTTMRERTVLERTLIAALRPVQNRNGLNAEREFSEPSAPFPNQILTH